MTARLVLVVCLVLVASSYGAPDGLRLQYDTTKQPKLVADVEFVAAGDSGVSGKVTLEQTGDNVLVHGTIHGLSKGKHGFHVHQNGQLGNGCKDAGGHFNPFMKNHGAPSDAERHVGDLGNIETNTDSSSTQVMINDKTITLEQDSVASILDRAIVIHAGEDDLGRGGNPGSKKTGNAGPRLACGIIKLRKLIADVEFVAAGDSGVSGKVTLEQTGNNVIVHGTIQGLRKGNHGFHVHQKGQLGNGCKDAGGHFNPFMRNHGAPTDADRHVGDLGNIQTNSDGSPTDVMINDQIISLEKDSTASILQRAIVIHAGEDDLGRGGNPGSLITGNAGPRLACGIIKLRQE